MTSRARRPPRQSRRGKALGQHFLRDGSTAARIVRAARVAPGDTVLEIGPGRGALTRRLAELARTLVLVEMDHALAEALRERHASSTNVHVVEADAREFEPGACPALSGAEYITTANLPYYAASPIIRNLLEAAHPPRSMVVMAQREVAQEMTAAPGRMGMLSVATQLYAEAELLFDVPPGAFSPPPKVTSSVVRLTRRPALAADVDDVNAFFRLARAGFSAPRKQIRNTLSRGLEIEPSEALRLLEEADIDSTRRPATLALSEWGALYRAWRRPDGAPQEPVE
ncbi:MAG: 16S rRNA (adenine(1518)-N(6)/adenine(1519)-N(6))-dimethyltransferase RsmA [Chloroflexota bacterium]